MGVWLCVCVFVWLGGGAGDCDIYHAIQRSKHYHTINIYVFPATVFQREG